MNQNNVDYSHWRVGGNYNSASAISKYRRTEGAYRLICEGILHMVSGIYFFSIISSKVNIRKRILDLNRASLVNLFVLQHRIQVHGICLLWPSKEGFV